MPLHDPSDPDIILMADPFEDVDAIPLQDPPSTFPKHEMRPMVTPTNSSNPPFQSSSLPVESHSSSVSAEKVSKASRPEQLGHVEPQTTCQACKKASSAATARGAKGRCDCERKSSPINDEYSHLPDHDTQKFDAEAGLDIQWSLASLPRSANGAVGYGVVGRHQSQGKADIWAGAGGHMDDVIVDEVRNSYGRI